MADGKIYKLENHNIPLFKNLIGRNPFVYILQRKIIGGGLMEQDLREVIGNQLILNIPLISELKCLFDEAHIQHFSTNDQI